MLPPVWRVTDTELRVEDAVQVQPHDENVTEPELTRDDAVPAAAQLTRPVDPTVSIEGLLELHVAVLPKLSGS